MKRSLQMKSRKVTKAGKPTSVKQSPRKSGVTSNPVRVRHREMLGSLAWTTGDNPDFVLTQNLVISPTDPTTFPWLSQIAANFEYYNFQRLTIEYVPRCSVMQSGSVAMAIDYDIADVPPIHMEDLQLYMGVIPFAVYERAKLVADGRSLHLYPYRYLRINGSTSDPRLECIGKFVVGLSTSSVATFGDFYIDYDVELYAPQFAEPGGLVRTSGPTSSQNTSPLPGSNTNYYIRDVGIKPDTSHEVDVSVPSDGKYLLEYLSPAHEIEDMGDLILGDPNKIIRAASLLSSFQAFYENKQTNIVSAILDLEPSRTPYNENFFSLYFSQNQSWSTVLAGMLTLIKLGDSFKSGATPWNPTVLEGDCFNSFVCKFPNTVHKCERESSTSIPNLPSSDIVCTCTNCTCSAKRM